MKNSIKTLFATALTLVVVTGSAFASTTESQNGITVLNQVKNISKIEVKGNVEVILVQAPVESVKVYDSYYAKNALVQQNEGVLRISSFQKETLTVAVYVRNLSAIEAGDDAVISTYGKISFLSLAVNLTGNAKATINANTIDLTTDLKDNASLKLVGSTTAYFATLGSKAKMSLEDFTANSSTINHTLPLYAKIATAKKQTLENLVFNDELAK